MKKILKLIVDKSIIPVFRKVSVLGNFATYIATNVDRTYYQGKYDHLKAKFIQNGERSRWGRDVRSAIVERFETIDRQVSIGSTPADGLFLAEALLSLEADGAVVECGCYAGGSTAKLSIVASILGKELFVFDSFAGLPEMSQKDAVDHHLRRSTEWFVGWEKGAYAATLEGVYSNVEKFGEISVCHFHTGWFSETLIEGIIPEHIAFAFTDVDLASSAKECIQAIWPRISNEGVYFSHDVAYVKVLQSMFDERLWRDVFVSYPPILIGGGFGLGDASPHLGYMVKGTSLHAEYINNLMIEK